MMSTGFAAWRVSENYGHYQVVTMKHNNCLMGRITETDVFIRMFFFTVSLVVFPQVSAPSGECMVDHVFSLPAMVHKPY